MTDKEIEDLNMFMVCDSLNRDALTDIPKGYHIRTCKKNELDIWAEFPFDTEEDKKKNINYMYKYFENVYSKNVDEFYKRCLFVCDENDKPVCTCFIWRAYDKVNTIHWFKTLKQYEGKGLGRALLSYIMKDLKENDFPVFLHTQPGSYRAIGLYSSFGFKVITDEKIGNRTNDYKKALDYLKKKMTKETFENLQFVKAPKILDSCAKKFKINEF